MRRLAFLSLLLLFSLGAGEQLLIDSSFTGRSLPNGWKGDAGRAITEEGQTSTRLEGDHHLSFALPTSTEKEIFYRLSLLARSPRRTHLALDIKATKPGPALWHAVADLPEVWTESNYIIQPPDAAGPAQLTLSIPENGLVDLAHLTLTKMSRQQIIEQIKRDHPQEGKATNLLHQTQFPLGIPSGGAIGRDISDEQFTIQADEKMIGPGGGPALHLHSQPAMRFFLPPVDLQWTFTKHTASIYVRGTGHGALYAIADGGGIAGQPFTAKPDEWTRVILTFDPRFLAREHQLLIESQGDVWIDAAQLEIGDHATEYVRAPELALGWPTSETSAARVQFDDEPPRILWRAVNYPANSRVCGKYFDVAGHGYTLPPLQLHASSGFFQLPDRLGAFRVEAWIEDSSHQRISQINEALLTRVHRPRYWNVDAPQSHFGIHMGPASRQMILAKSLGINWVRLHDAGVEAVAWSYLEPEKGKWNWQDAEIRLYRAHHISILGSLTQAPAWTTGLPHPANDYWERYLEPKNLDDFANYVRTITKHYQSEIRYWDVWNEPWLKYWSKWDAQKNESVRSPQAAEEYVHLEQTAYDAAKSVDPKLTILGVNTTGHGHGNKWTTDVVATGGLVPCDIYDYHHYNSERAGFLNDVVERYFAQTWDPALKKLGGKFDKPVWMTEGNGTNTLIDRGLYHYSAPGTEPEDPLDVSDRLARYLIATLARGVDKIFLYHMNMGGEWHPGFGPFQTVVTDDGYVHPCGAALAEVAWQLDDAKFVKRISVANGVYAYVFANKNRTIAAISSAPNAGPYILPTDGEDLFGNPVKRGSLFNGHVVYLHASEKQLIHG